MDAELEIKFREDPDSAPQIAPNSAALSPEAPIEAEELLTVTPTKLPPREVSIPRELRDQEPEISDSKMFLQLKQPGEYTFKGPYRMFDGGLRYVDQDVVISSRKGWPTVDCVCASITFSRFFGENSPKRTWQKEAVMGYAICPGKPPGQSNEQVILDLRDATLDRESVTGLARLAARIFRENMEFIAKHPENTADFDPIDSACQELLGYCKEMGVRVSIHRGSLYP